MRSCRRCSLGRRTRSSERTPLPSRRRAARECRSSIASTRSWIRWQKPVASSPYSPVVTSQNVWKPRMPPSSAVTVLVAQEGSGSTGLGAT
eukprot:1548555-Prymnesium_polylepis.1